MFSTFSKYSFAFSTNGDNRRQTNNCNFSLYEKYVCIDDSKINICIQHQHFLKLTTFNKTKWNDNSYQQDAKQKKEEEKQQYEVVFCIANWTVETFKPVPLFQSRREFYICFFFLFVFTLRNFNGTHMLKTY